jgi:hypothetical protein
VVAKTSSGPGEVAAYMGRSIPRQHPFFALLQSNGLTSQTAVFRANRTLKPIVSALKFRRSEEPNI